MSVVIVVWAEVVVVVVVSVDDLVSGGEEPCFLSECVSDVVFALLIVTKLAGNKPQRISSLFSVTTVPMNQSLLRCPAM